MNFLAGWVIDIAFEELYVWKTLLYYYHFLAPEEKNIVC